VKDTNKEAISTPASKLSFWYSALLTITSKSSYIWVFPILHSVLWSYSSG